MPSPFPGMDPYLEEPHLWRGFHVRLITTTGRHLQRQLRPRYYVDVEETAYICGPDDPAVKLIVPDVSVSDLRGGLGSTGGRRGTAVVEPAVVEMLTCGIDVPERRLEIRTLPGNRLVTVIEILSPVNKTPGSKGRNRYLRKRNRVMQSDVHLVEIDLLRAGERFPAVGVLPAGDYYVHVSRVERRPMGEVWGLHLREALPEIPIPLGKGDTDAALRLGGVLSEAYEEGSYDLRLDYASAPPRPALSARDSRWVSTVLSRTRRK